VSKSNQKHVGKCPRWLMVLLTGLVVVCASSIWPAGTARRAIERKDDADVEAQLRVAAFRSASKAATTGFEVSLEMKENVDFLLTPALLVQEAMSEDVIVTYPSE